MAAIMKRGPLLFCYRRPLEKTGNFRAAPQIMLSSKLAAFPQQQLKPNRAC